ncbi:MAG: hypothetical protein LBT89_02760 [Planctomycetaceae bacterium]|jgi:diaminohydroxyphosphoribosylaminopyrimidine deaminase/5-amino-6-(5-phosphoribosylamino)uracil reductase|nr:hypothetical protein [Planctomycetaceae bacterium]
MEHERFMQESLKQMKQGESFVEPNPMVGYVIVQNQQIVAQGFHAQFG